MSDFVAVYPDLWPSVFWHPTLHLLMVVYVDDFKMSGPKENLAKGWKLIGERIDMDTPCTCNRYLGCDHIFTENVKLSVAAHPFAHLFDKSLPDPAAKPASSAVRRQDFWESDCHPVLVHNHLQPRRRLYTPDAEVFGELGISPIRFTEIEHCQPGGVAACATRTIWDRTDETSNHDKLPLWTGTTYFFHYSCDPKKAMAALKRNKLAAKQKVRAQSFKFLDEVETSQGCMNRPVNVVSYDMKPFLQSCVKRYQELAGSQCGALKHVSTPFHEERIARPVADENEPKGVLQPIASKVLMKILFAARMSRFDLLRAVQGLAARVTQWSTSCDAALRRLVCYINSTLDLRLQGFVGDQVMDCKLYLFADADHAGECDNRSTSGGFLVLVGPNTYFPLTAFSKKQTATAMSSTESEVVAANLSLRAVGLPSSGLWAYLRSVGGDGTLKCSPGGGLPTKEVIMKADKTGDHWEFHPGGGI